MSPIVCKIPKQISTHWLHDTVDSGHCDREENSYDSHIVMDGRIQWHKCDLRLCNILHYTCVVRNSFSGSMSTQLKMFNHPKRKCTYEM